MRSWPGLVLLVALGACSSAAKGPAAQTSSACGMESCGDTCSDPGNCGGCGNVCVTGGTCNDGVCECPAGDTVCNGACVGPQTSPGGCQPVTEDDAGLPQGTADGAPHDAVAPTDATTVHPDASMTCDPAATFACGTSTCTVPTEICAENLYDAGKGPTWGCAPTPSNCGCAPTCGCVETSTEYQLLTSLTCSMTSGGAVIVVFDVQGIQP